MFSSALLARQAIGQPTHNITGVHCLVIRHVKPSVNQHTISPASTALSSGTSSHQSTNTQYHRRALPCHQAREALSQPTHNITGEHCLVIRHVKPSVNQHTISPASTALSSGTSSPQSTNTQYHRRALPCPQARQALSQPTHNITGEHCLVLRHVKPSVNQHTISPASTALSSGTSSPQSTNTQYHRRALPCHQARQALSQPTHNITGEHCLVIRHVKPSVNQHTISPASTALSSGTSSHQSTNTQYHRCPPPCSRAQ